MILYKYILALHSVSPSSLLKPARRHDIANAPASTSLVVIGVGVGVAVAANPGASSSTPSDVDIPTLRGLRVRQSSADLRTVYTG